MIFTANASTIVVPDKKGKKRANNSAGTSTSSKGALKDFNIEYAKSGRAGCRGCEQKILKGEVIIQFLFSYLHFFTYTSTLYIYYSTYLMI